jgi:diaminohydroxyphosphoribosylaminopyrimidine deaminase/5-amino-6-(5-phosphoribosylamino)uracil reductase
MHEDEHYMRLCLELASNAKGRTSPNPLVGAVLVDGSGKVVGQGYHHAAGQAHAEVEALSDAGTNARGQTLFVNLEPCCHVGRTAACTDAVVKSGVRRVVYGMVDPNPKVAGAGAKNLSQAGIEVAGGVLEKECRLLNRFFCKWIKTRRPWVCLKMAATLDGRIADREGQSRWITGEAARAHVQQMRDVYDCVLIGGATAVKDDPELNVKGIAGARNPVRAVVDPGLALSPQARLCRKSDDGSYTAVFTTEAALADKGAAFPPHVKLVAVKENAHGLDLDEVLAWLAAHEILSVYAEGGGRLAGALLTGRLIDEIHWLIAPTLMMDSLAVAAVSSDVFVPLNGAVRLREPKVSQLGDDVLIQGLINFDFA